jgi:hypothetical protein
MRNSSRKRRRLKRATTKLGKDLLRNLRKPRLITMIWNFNLNLP